MTSNEHAEAIVNLRGIMLVLSYIYYGGDGLPADAESPYSDAMYDNWAQTLKTLQRKHPTNKFGFYDEEFADWGMGSFSGMHLPRTDDVRQAALALLEKYRR